MTNDRRAQEEQHRANQYFDRKIRESTIAGLKAAGRAAELNSEIERRERLGRSNTYLKGMCEQKAFILKELSTLPKSNDKKRWYRSLSNVDLTHRGADAELKNLLEEMEKARVLLHLQLAELRSTPGLAEGQPSSADPLEVIKKQLNEDRAIAIEFNEGALALVVSSLSLLISTKNLYESTLSRL